ncbi:MAG TPA: hypothetical protein PKX87_03160, partial [Alphaproteobacteria bacterium]|nr:hypothetical protein [Alphaproteobacteria bacterium]
EVNQRKALHNDPSFIIYFRPLGNKHKKLLKKSFPYTELANKKQGSRQNYEKTSLSSLKSRSGSVQQGKDLLQSIQIQDRKS